MGAGGRTEKEMNKGGDREIVSAHKFLGCLLMPAQVLSHPLSLEPGTITVTKVCSLQLWLPGSKHRSTTFWPKISKSEAVSFKDQQ